jgi:multiple sugar transport system substrate-binding protein
MISRLPQAAAAGQVPDIVKMYTPLVPQVASAGVYQPLPEAASKIDDWLLPVDQLVDDQGRQIAVPQEYRTCSLFYNQKILDELGLTVPTTWDELVASAKAASEAGYVGFGTGFSDVDNSAIISELFDCFMAELDQPLVDDEGQAAFATAKAEEFSQFLVELNDAGALSSSVVADQYSTVTDGLSNGTVAFGVLGTQRVVTIQSVNPDVKWTQLPAASNGSQVGATFGFTYGIGSSSTHADAAWTFIEYMTGAEAQARMATGGEVPVRASTYDEDFFSTSEAETVLAIRDYVEQYSTPNTYAPNWLKIATGLASAGQQMVLNGISAKEMLTVAQDAGNS